MSESSIQCIGGVLFGLSHPSNIDTFTYTDSRTGKSVQYTKKIIHRRMFFVANTIDQKFAEQLALQLLKT